MQENNEISSKGSKKGSRTLDVETIADDECEFMGGNDFIFNKGNLKKNKK